MILAIDFDHTIQNNVDVPPGRKMGRPFTGAKESLEALRVQGHKIIIHSCNRPQVIRDWMQYWKIPYDYIWGESPSDHGQKPVADYYIDDRAIKFEGNWTQTLMEILK